MQNIKIWLVNEGGEAIEKSTINFVPVMQVIFKIENFKERYPLLSGIDPYGNTYFNVHQIPRAIDELRSMKEDEKSLVLNEIEDVVKFLAKTKQHTFTKFIGD